MTGTLSGLQQRFSQDAALLITQAVVMGYQVTLGEAYRTPQQAQWDAQQGTGIANSLHCQRLAIDLNLFKDGVYLTESTDYEPLGDWWKNLGADHYWGGDFTDNPDGNHFSISPDGGKTR